MYKSVLRQRILAVHSGESAPQLVENPANSPHLKAMAKVCAEICKSYAKKCEPHIDHLEVCKACMNACKECADACAQA